MTLHRRLLAITVLSVLGIALGACSDDEESLSEEEYLEQANAICAAGSDELDAVAEELFSDEEPTQEQLSSFADTFDENIGGQIDDIQALDGPDELEGEVDSLLDDAKDVLAEFTGLLRTDVEAALAEDPFVEINEQFVELGLDDCAS